jgi:hypothetical protein
MVNIIKIGTIGHTVSITLNLTRPLSAKTGIDSFHMLLNSEVLRIISPPFRKNEA